MNIVLFAVAAIWVMPILFIALLYLATLLSPVVHQWARHQLFGT